jgi:hypothetical protein
MASPELARKPLTVAERIHRMPHGGQHEVAEAEGVSGTYVSLLLAARLRMPEKKEAQLKMRKVARACARKIGEPFEIVFPELVTASAVETAS